MPATRSPRQRVPADPAAIEAASQASEKWFARYLQDHGICAAYEPSKRPGKKNPDFVFEYETNNVRCEVKTLFRPFPLPRGVFCFDGGYKSVRKEIHESRKQFKPYRSDCCVLVLRNENDWTFRDEPEFLFAAMLGDFAWSLPIGASRDGAWPGPTRAFTRNGKMIDPKSGAAQNTTVSAIAVLSTYRKRNPEFERAYRERVPRRDTRKWPTHEELLESWRVLEELRERIPSELALVKRVRVFENPFARHPIPDGLFRGDFDERYRFRLRDRTGEIECGHTGKCLDQGSINCDRTPDRAAAIDRFARDVAREFEPTRVILFGSHAYGQPRGDSDVDLLVVFAGSQPQDDRALEIRGRIRCDFAMDLLTRSEGQIKRRVELGDPFMREILERGFVLYEAAHA
ncbi:Nucleotidyltransferase domain protein [Phycisphaerae bacterium RAS1]|nr:Nucleotidyltransferase domain protein [Phycisphaerae bacterium RAS1]